MLKVSTPFTYTCAGGLSMSRNVSGKVHQDDVGAFNEQRQYNCPLCGRACVCVRLNLFPSDKPVFATLYWECEVCSKQ